MIVAFTPITPLSNFPNKGNDQRVIQWNVRSLIPRKPEIINLIKGSTANVCALCETLLRPGSVCNISYFNVERRGRGDGHGGVTFLIKHGIAYRCLNLRPRDGVIEIVEVQIVDINILSLYFSPNIPPF